MWKNIGGLTNEPLRGKFIIFLHAPSPPFFCLDILQSPFHLKMGSSEI
jgi:hypothetical protein